MSARSNLKSSFKIGAVYFSLILASASRGATAGTPEELLRSFLTETHCLQTPDQFRGCVAAVGAFGQPPTLLPEYLEWRTSVEAAYARERVQRSLSFPHLLESHLHRPADRETSVLSALDRYFTYRYQDPHVNIRAVKAVNSAAASVALANPLESGVRAVPETGGLRITRIIPETAADEADLREGDLIIEVNGRPAGAVDLKDELKASPGHELSLSVKRADIVLPVTLKARALTLLHVSSARIMTEKKVPLGYVRIRTFESETVCASVRNSMLQLHSEGVSGWILDLRGNGGGFLREVACVAGLFLAPENGMFWSRRIEGTRVAPVADWGYGPRDPNSIPGLSRGTIPASGVFPVREPLVVLLDEMTASAAELFAASLRYYGRSLSVGLTTYGKGVTLGYSDSLIQKYGTFVYSTSHVSVLPDGSTPHLQGVSPDFRVERGTQYEFQRENRTTSESTLVPPVARLDLPKTSFKEAPQISQLRECVTRFDLNAWEVASRGQKHLPDRQKRYAEAVLSCWLETGYPVRGDEKVQNEKERKSRSRKRLRSQSS